MWDLDRIRAQQRGRVASSGLLLAGFLVACGTGDHVDPFVEPPIVAQGLLHSCPRISTYTASPIRTDVGKSIELTSSASDVETPKTLTFVWIALNGSFGDPTAQNTEYRCEQPGQQELTLVVTDGTCGDSAKISVECLAN